MSVSTVSQALVGQGQAANTKSQLSTDYDSFITLLVAQVQNQDPLAPMESTEFVSQLAQLTQVEQSVQVNTHMENLRQQLALNAALSETSLIGRQVTLPSDQIEVTENGTEFWYRLDQDAVAVSAELYDAAGNLVKTFGDLAVSAGSMHAVSWDGMNTQGGQALPGNYRLKIKALDADGVAGLYQSYSSGQVIAVDYSQGATQLQLSDGRQVASGEIIRAR